MISPLQNKVYYTVKEVSTMTGVPPSTLRFWEGQFELLNPARTKKKQRKYTAKDIEIVQLIRHFLVDKKMKIEGAKPFITEQTLHAVKRRVDLVNKLKSIRDSLSEISNQF